MTNRFNEIVAQYALSTIDSIGPYRQVELIRRFGSAQAVFETALVLLNDVPFLNETQKKAIVGFEDFERCRLVVKNVEARGVNILSFQDPNYPARLREIASFPTLLFYRGDPDVLAAQKVLGVVGSRKMTPYGERVLKDIIPALVANKVLVMSGLAFGVDICAHKACLEHGGHTVAVMAQGVMRASPRVHQKCFEQILESSGAVISEFGFVPEEYMDKGLFPRRNRLISGLSDAVLVVEAAERSGALITARFALDQNRGVLAVPGNIYQEMSQGCLRLIEQGARPVKNVDDILDELGLIDASAKKQGDLFEDIVPPDLFASPLEVKIQVFCTGSAHTLDEIIEAVCEPASFVSATITKMQLMGSLEDVGGRRFQVREG